MIILIVDDKTENRYMLEVLLKGNGHETRSASNGAEAFELLKTDRIDLIISDILMPVMDGFELCRKVRADDALRRIPFIIYTATYTGPQDEEFALKIGADRFILKPCEPDVFMNAVRDVMDAKRDNSDSIQMPPQPEEEVLKLYNDRLVRKLEQKMLQLEKEVISRQKTEEILKQSEDKYRSLYDSIRDAILISDTNRMIIDCNAAFVEMFGYSMEEITGKKLYTCYKNKEEFREMANALKNHIGDASFLYSAAFKRKNGTIFPGEINVFYLRNSDGSLTGYIGLIRDITERKQTEEELQKHREHLEELVKERTNDLAKERNLLRTLIDSLPDEIYAKDMDSRFIIANSHVLTSFGRTNINEIIGKTDFEILPQNEAIKYYGAEHVILYSKGQMLNYEVSIQNADGNPCWYSITKVPMRNGDGNITGLVGINRDITYRKEIEENLTKAKEAAETANLAKSTFLSNMSHEIRTPLNAILGFSELMQSDDKVSKEHIEWLRTINRSGEHLLALINDILEVSRIEAGRISFNPSTFDIHSLLRDIEAMFRVKTDQKNLSLLFEYSDELPKTIATDEGKLRQIIINLVGNAVKFTKEGGVAFRAHVKQENDKMHLIAEVEDTGPGVAEEDIGKLFQKFGQTEAGIKEGGTGLGLAISQQYAKIMGGEITLKSKEGKGTCFTLTINIENGEELIKEENQKRKVIGLKPGQKLYRILVADDRANNRELLKIMLTSVGFEVEEAQNGNETIAKFKIWSPDLILMDMRMPVMNGYEATQKIKAMGNGKIRIIAVTASAFQEDMQKSLDAGADAYLRKPFKEHELFECIGSCLGVKYVYE
jgi:PAS domain S-box-containing protein